MNTPTRSSNLCKKGTSLLLEPHPARSWAQNCDVRQETFNCSQRVIDKVSWPRFVKSPQSYGVSLFRHFKHWAPQGSVAMVSSNEDQNKKAPKFSDRWHRLSTTGILLHIKSKVVNRLTVQEAVTSLWGTRPNGSRERSSETAVGDCAAVTYTHHLSTDITPSYSTLLHLSASLYLFL